MGSVSLLLGGGEMLSSGLIQVFHQSVGEVISRSLLLGQRQEKFKRKYIYFYINKISFINIYISI